MDPPIHIMDKPTLAKSGLQNRYMQGLVIGRNPYNTRINPYLVIGRNPYNTRINPEGKPEVNPYILRNKPCLDLDKILNPEPLWKILTTNPNTSLTRGFASVVYWIRLRLLGQGFVDSDFVDSDFVDYFISAGIHSYIHARIPINPGRKMLRKMLVFYSSKRRKMLVFYSSKRRKMVFFKTTEYGITYKNWIFTLQERILHIYFRMHILFYQGSFLSVLIGKKLPLFFDKNFYWLRIFILQKHFTLSNKVYLNLVFCSFCDMICI